jgi:dienelactone hydrolase
VLRRNKSALSVLVTAILAAALSAARAEPPDYQALWPTGDGPGTSAYPAVLLVPGCGGITPREGGSVYSARAAALQAAGFAVVLVDYVGRRALSNCAHVSRMEVAQDIREAAAWAASQPGIDGRRIAAIGWSYGAGGVLAAMAEDPPPSFGKAVLYYPDCRGARPWSPAGPAALLLLGALDDVAPPGLCDPVVRAMPPGQLRATLYPAARHGFDDATLPARADQPFGTIGYDPEAARASWEATLGFLQAP